jgi:site-specific DNA-methyltransferase (adenine-specific)/site-specific DNA-methyltransferase (cytosine-N4-specific)
LFTQEHDIVLDPFAGSGTTLRVAQGLRRNSIGIEIVPEYVELIKSQIKQKESNLF